ncbi:MAG: hypothetical protein PX637_19585, partial [Microcystis sp. M53601_WE4]|nr:hypothetical protein [Microcystis sp. M53601_WE4]
GGRRQEAVFVTGIYAPLQKLFALRRGFRPDFFDKLILSKKGHKTLKSLQSWGFCDPRILAGQNMGINHDPVLKAPHNLSSG